MAHHPDELTVEAIKTAAKEFALRINSEGFKKDSLSIPTSYALVRAFHLSVANRFHLPSPMPQHASEDELPAIGVTVLAALVQQPMASIPYQNAYQLVYGIGQPVVMFLYRRDLLPGDAFFTVTKTHVLFFQPEETGDRQVAQQILEILDGPGELDTKRTELVGLFVSLHPKLTRAEREDLASLVLQRPPAVGGLRYGSLQWNVQIPPTQIERFDLLSPAERASDASASQESAAHESAPDADQRDAAPSE